MEWQWLLFIVVLGSGNAWVSSCPDSCFCHHEQGLNVANCSSLPYNGGKIEVLNLLSTRESPVELSDGQFNSARHLKYLNLRNSSIYYIHKKAFYGAKNVIEIDLSFNFIEEIEPTVFQHLTSLTTLILRGNPIHFVSEVPFLISNSLQHLDIGQCKIRSVPRGIFYGLKRLKYLSMDGNFLKSVKYNSLPKGLKYLNLSQNLIVDVPTEVLSALTNLRRIGLSGNPINCTCSLMNFQDWISGRGVIFDEDVTCALPSEYQGLSWSKVDENKLCLAEARREEMGHSTIYDPLYKNGLYAENYLDSENRYLGEHFQSDQPQPILPDSQAEVLFQNDETLAMGEMMRDEEHKKDENDNSEPETIKETEIEADEEAATIGKTYELENVTEDEKVETLDIDTNVNNKSSEKEDSETKHAETVLNNNTDTSEVTHSVSLENDDLNLQDIESHTDISAQNKIEEHIEVPMQTHDNNTVTKSEEHIEESMPTDENTKNLEPSQTVNLNESHPVEYKQLNEEDSNTELDELTKEGLLHAEISKYKMSGNDSFEESTIIPDIEETTESEIDPTPDVFVQPYSSETNNTTTEESSAKSEENVTDTVPTVIIYPDFSSSEAPQNGNRIIQLPIPHLVPTVQSSGNKDSDESIRITDGPRNIEEQIKQVAGAEVVMFCIAVLLICLILFSIYKCRTSKKRQSMRIPKDMEANRGTELQDMASLLPKPEDDEKKNNKYPDKAPSSETMKLIPESNENEIPSFTPVADKNKIETKNSINNNTPHSPTSKTPLIKPETPITINPAAPIQRTKAKVGIIPDSIPRTPIFLQKAYNNGTKHL